MSFKLNFGKIRRQHLTPYLFLLPALLMLALTVFIPAFNAFYLSFTHFEYDLTQAPKWIGLANLQRLFQDEFYWKTLTNTLIYLLVVVHI